MAEMAEDGWRALRSPVRRGDPMAASPFSRLAIAHALSVAGDTCVTMALAGSLFFDISPTAARGKVALSLVLTMAPFAIVAPLLGPAIDKRRGGRKFTVAGAAGGRAITALAMAAVVDGLLLFPAAFLTLVLSKAHAVARSSLVPTTVSSDEELVEANAKLALGSAVVGFVAAGPAIAVLQLASSAWTLRLAAVIFALAAIAATRIVQSHPDNPAAKEVGDAELSDRGIVMAATAMAVLRGMVGFLTFLVAFTFRRAGAPSWWFGVVLAASVGGTLIGAALAPRLRDRVREERMLAGALVAVGAGALVAARLQGRPAAAIAAAVLGLAASAGKLAFDSLVQRDAPDAVQGRSFARFEAIFQLVWVVGALVPVLVPVPDEVGYFLLMLAALLTAVAYATGRIPSRRRVAPPIDQ